MTRSTGPPAGELDQESTRRVDDRSARSRIPAVFQQAFLVGVPDVTELLLVRHGQQELDPDGPWVISSIRH